MHPFACAQVPVGGIALHWFGQNSFAVRDARGTDVQIDPYFPEDRPADEFLHPKPVEESDLRTELVLLTHDHRDHTCPESVLRIHAAFPEAVFAGPVESIERLRSAGVACGRLHALKAGTTWRHRSVVVHSAWAKPAAGVPGEGIPPPEVTHLCYVVELGGVSLFVSGDLIHSFAEHDELIEPVRALRPELGILTMHPTEGEFPFFEGAVRLACRLGLGAAIPSHYECFTRRTYDPAPWARMLAAAGPTPVVVPWNASVLWSPGGGGAGGQWVGESDD